MHIGYPAYLSAQDEQLGARYPVVHVLQFAPVQPVAHVHRQPATSVLDGVPRPLQLMCEALHAIAVHEAG